LPGQHIRAAAGKTLIGSDILFAPAVQNLGCSSGVLLPNLVVIRVLRDAQKTTSSLLVSRRDSFHNG
jgi:hypothetical protein